MVSSHQERTNTASFAAANCTEMPNVPSDERAITMTGLIFPSGEVITDTKLTNFSMKLPKKWARLAFDLKPAGYPRSQMTDFTRELTSRLALM